MTTSTTHLMARRAIELGAQQKLNELAEFLDLLAGIMPQVVVEIGVAEGATLWAWQQVAPTVIGVDDGDYHYTAPTDAPIIVGDSHDPKILAELTELLDGAAVDCLFIDGDHSYAGVQQDFDMYRHLVKPGGLVAFHDIASVSHDPDYELSVPRFWAELLLQPVGNSAVEIIDTTPGSGGRWGDEWGGIGVLTL